MITCIINKLPDIKFLCKDYIKKEGGFHDGNP